MKPELNKGLSDVKVLPFKLNNLEVHFCPWLQFWTNNHSQRKAQGMIILQDWGLVEELDLDKLAEGLKKSFKGDSTEIDDLTIKSLKSIPILKRLIHDGEIMVMNAIWGCRSKESKKSGYLGDEIHAAAFPLWSEIVKQFSNKEEWFVVFAGEWARFERMTKADNELKAFMQRWAKWSNNGAEKFNEVKGKAFFCPHPAVWKFAKEETDGFILENPTELFSRFKK